jgi:TPR repeat protein
MAFRYLKVAADRRFNDAQFMAGLAFDHGEDVPVYKAEAVRYYKLAADHGHVPAQHLYGAILLDQSNFALAFQYFKSAADGGWAASQVCLGLALMSGAGVIQNKVEAVRYFRMAADQGHHEGDLQLGLCLLDGAGTSRVLGLVVQ